MPCFIINININSKYYYELLTYYNKFMITLVYRAVKLWDHGFTSHWKNKYLPSSKECNVDLPPKSKMRQLNLNDFSITFLIFLSGISSSFIVFALSLIYRRLNIKY